MSTYLGNASLSPAVKDRVLSTFEQAVALFRQGRTEEVVQGCGLILRMDPMFDPAKKLLEKARNPAAPIDVDSLVPARPAAGAADPVAEARTALANRDFERALHLTTELLRADFTNEDARVINDAARERLEASPFVEQFIRKAETFAGQGNNAAARAELEKARALDGEHPGVRRVLESIAAAEAATPPQAFSFGDTPSFVVDTPAAPPAGRGAAQAVDFGFTFEEEKPAAPAAPEPSFGFSFDPPPSAPAAPPPAEPPAFSFDAPPATPAAPEPSGFSFDAPAPFAPPAPAPFTPPPPPPAPTPAAPAQSGGFSFDAPPAPSFDFGAPAAAPSAGSFDFTTAPETTSEDDQKKIRQYLADGDRALTAGDYQQAIDLWSRIFLIDVTNDEASQRIESAKQKRREAEQKVEAIVSAGVHAFNTGDQETARAKFNEALRIDPANTTAHDYIERMSTAVAEGGAAGFVDDFVPPPPKDDLFDDDAMSGSYEVPAIPEPVVAPPPKKKAAAKADKEKAPAKKRSASTGIIATIAGVVVAAALGWFVWSKYMSGPSTDPAATQAIFKQAGVMAQRGRYDDAIRLLQDVKADDPQHDHALEMIADLQHRKAQASEMINGRPASVVFDENLTAGRAAFEQHDYDRAKAAFDAAARIKALPPDVRQMYDTAAQQVAKLEGAKSLFKEQKYADAITNLQALAQADPQNASVKRMLTDAHFNLGAVALQEEKTGDAMREFDEVLKSDANDELARRSRTLADRYNGQPKDLLYKIYVKYLPLRAAA